MRKLYLSILYVVFISLIISGTILLSKPEKVSRIDSSYSGVLSDGFDSGDEEVNATASKKNNSIAIPEKEILVLNNTPSFNLHAVLTENEQGLLVLKLTYSLKGKQVKRSIDASQIEEIRRIAPMINKPQNNVEIKNLLLNRKMSKLYISIQSKTTNGYYYSVIYSHKLSNSSIEEIYSQAGHFSDFSLSPDENYFAFSFISQKHSTAEDKAKSVVIIKCNNNCEVFNSSREIRKSEMDPASDFSYYNIYSYYLKSWGSNNTCELNKGIISKDGRAAPISKTILLSLKSGAVIE